MARPFLPMNDKWRSEFRRPRDPENLPAIGSLAPDFKLPYAITVPNQQGELEVQYGRMLQLSDLRGRPVALNLTRIVSDRFF